MTPEPALLAAERGHLADLLEAVQRCGYFLDASECKLPYPLAVGMLEARHTDPLLFEPLAAVNERFAKLQDTLGAAMRHAHLLLGERGDSFLKVLAFFAKVGVVDSVETWQTCRTARNLAAHDYEIEYTAIAEHFNTLHELAPMLIATALRLCAYCAEHLAVASADVEMASLFQSVCERRAGS